MEERRGPLEPPAPLRLGEILLFVALLCGALAGIYRRAPSPPGAGELRFCFLWLWLPATLAAIPLVLRDLVLGPQARFHWTGRAAILGTATTPLSYLLGGPQAATLVCGLVPIWPILAIANSVVTRGQRRAFWAAATLLLFAEYVLAVVLIAGGAFGQMH